MREQVNKIRVLIADQGSHTRLVLSNILEAEPDRYAGLPASAIRTRLGLDMQRTLRGRPLDPILR